MTDPHLTVLHALADNDGTVARQALEGLGHRVVEVKRRCDAVTALDRLRPHLIIVDDAFDGGHGPSFIAHVRASQHSAWAPVLLTSGVESPAHALREAIESGADDCLPKPLDPALLTLRLHALQRIAAAYSGLRAVIDNVLEAIILIDGAGIIRSFNAAAEEVFGYPAGEVIGRNVSMLMPSPYREEHDRYIANFRETRQPRVIGIGRQVTAQRKSGEVFPAHLAVSAVSGSRRDSFIGLIRDLSAERDRERLAHLALHDTLTGLPNRAQFSAALDVELERATNPDSVFALLFIDVDHFKQINDRHGHGIGDAVLSTIAGRLTHSVNRRDLVARLAGDEFVVLLRGVPDRHTAESVAARLRDAVGARLVFDACVLHVQISIGIAIFGEDGCDATSLIDAADKAMYRVKHLRPGEVRR